MGRTGYEPRDELDAKDMELKARLEAIRLAAGQLMGLGDVSSESRAQDGPRRAAGCGRLICAPRSFIPHECHASIGVLAAVSGSDGCVLPGSPAALRGQGPARSREDPVGRAPDG